MHNDPMAEATGQCARQVLDDETRAAVNLDQRRIDQPTRAHQCPDDVQQARVPIRRPRDGGHAVSCSCEVCGQYLALRRHAARVGTNPGRVTTQGEILAAHFAAAGYCVTAVSRAANRYARLLDIVGTLVRSRWLIDTTLIQVYGGPSFVVEDLASALARRFGHRIVMHLRGGAMPAFMARFPGWTQRVLGRADAVVAPSPFLARAVARFGYAAHTIPNLIDVSTYAFRRRGPASPRLFWMRSFHAAYNPMMAVRVLAQVRSSLPGATLVMGGQDNGLQDSVRAAAVRLGVQ